MVLEQLGLSSMLELYPLGNKRLKSYLLRTSDKIIPVSKFLGKIVQKRYRLSQNKIIPIKNNISIYIAPIITAIPAPPPNVAKVLPCFFI